MKKIGKTKKCNWCEKRKSIQKGWLLGDVYDGKPHLFICYKCNLKHDIV